MECIQAKVETGKSGALALYGRCMWNKREQTKMKRKKSERTNSPHSHSIFFSISLSHSISLIHSWHRIIITYYMWNVKMTCWSDILCFVWYDTWPEKEELNEGTQHIILLFSFHALYFIHSYIIQDRFICGIFIFISASLSWRKTEKNDLMIWFMVDRCYIITGIGNVCQS